MAETWTVNVTVSVHGVWDPADRAACAQVIAVVNAARCEADGDPRPVIRRIWWREDEDEESPYLDVAINGHRFGLSPGEHLVSTDMPDGTVLWAGLGNDELDMFRPEPEGASAL